MVKEQSVMLRIWKNSDAITISIENNYNGKYKQIKCSQSVFKMATTIWINKTQIVTSLNGAW